MKIVFFAVFLFFNNMSYAQNMISPGTESGGGGDASEMTINSIRADILKWILAGGSKGLRLPPGITLEMYDKEMSAILRPKFVTIGFVENDNSQDEELRVNVGGVPKTCRGFKSRKTEKFHIICNIGRFEKRSESEQYALIHHEYAGLASIERNDGAASDYEISSQITDFLNPTTSLKLGIKDLTLKEFCIGDMVFFKNEVRNIQFITDKGTITLKEIFPTHSKKVTTASKISKVVLSYEGFSTGEIVMYEDEIREIKLLDDTGRVLLKASSPSYKNQVFVTNKEISKLRNCTGESCR